MHKHVNLKLASYVACDASQEATWPSLKDFLALKISVQTPQLWPSFVYDNYFLSLGNCQNIGAIGKGYLDRKNEADAA